MISSAKMGPSKEDRKVVKQQKAEEKRRAKELKAQEKQRKKVLKKATKEAKKRNVDVNVVLQEQGLASDGSPATPKKDMAHNGNCSQDSTTEHQQDHMAEEETKQSSSASSTAQESDTGPGNEGGDAPRSDADDNQEQERTTPPDNTPSSLGQAEKGEDEDEAAGSSADEASDSNPDEAQLSTDDKQEEAAQQREEQGGDSNSTKPAHQNGKNASGDDGDGGPPSQDDMADKDDGGEAGPSVPPREPPKLTRQRWANRSSIRGAPVQLIPGQKAGPIQHSSDKMHVVEDDIVEDEADDQVGNMAHSNARETAEYLQDTVERFKEAMRAKWDNGTNSGYIEEYRSIATVGITQPCTAALAEPNRLKNRYGNILAYDRWRVKLSQINNEPCTDYINASFVDGYKHPNGYIATQGPVPNSFVDFWRMVWEQRVQTIVMVTHEVERGRMKCHRYWPDPTSNPPLLQLQYGDVTVTHVSSAPHKHYILRTFCVQRAGEEEREVRQFAFTSWPDHGVPLTTAEMLGFRNAVNHSIADTTAPIVIHCSAGVGRTGTYIAIDRLVRQALDMGGELDVKEVVAKMRERRCYMVQTEIQYIFIYRAVMDCLRELLHGESRKAEREMQDVEQQQALRRAAEDAEKAKKLEREREQREIEEARKELVARGETSVDNARAVVTTSIQDRMQMLQEAEAQWLENYQRSLQEWNDRNQFEAEQYDLTSSLTPVQSRLEALKQKGMLV